MPERTAVANAKDVDRRPIAKTPHYEGGLTFRTKGGSVAVLRPALRRHLSDDLITAGDTAELRYQHALTREAMLHPQVTADVTKRITERLATSDRVIATGLELEGTMYTSDGRNLLAVHDGQTVTFKDAPPERYSAQLEVVSDTTREGNLPSSPVEIANCLGDAVGRGQAIADRRNGIFVISSVPEGGRAEQIVLTDHDYIRAAHARGQTGIHPNTPEEARRICKQVGLTDIIPFDGEHRHTSNPELPETGLFSSRIAYAKGLIRLTQLAQVQNFSLFNTRHLVGKELRGVTDVRSIIRRTTGGAHGSAIPGDAYEMVEGAIRAVEEGQASLFSRLPAEQHERVRPLKECGSTESVVGAANPDLRIDLANMFMDQILDAIVYKGLTEVKGDETKLMDHLKDTYDDAPYLFEVLGAMDGPNNCYQQDLLFNQYSFATGSFGRSYADQMDDIRKIVRNIGKQFPGLKTQAQIVDHVYGKVTELPISSDMKYYLDINTGIKPGITTAYKTADIAKNMRDQAEGTRAQADALRKVRTDRDLLAFFGIAN